MNKDTYNKGNDFYLHTNYKSIRVNFTKEEYGCIMSDNKYFKERLIFFIQEYPDLFPKKN